MTRFIVSLAVFAVLSGVVGLLLSGDDAFDWWTALGLFGIALAGESALLWIRRSRARSGQSSGI